MRTAWKTLVLTNLAFKAISFTMLTPLLGILLRVLLATSGSPFLSDMEILEFLLGIGGAASFLLVGSVWLGILALEQASLLGILSAANLGLQLTSWNAIRFAFRNAVPVLRATAHLTARLAMVIVPFVLAAAATYYALLTEYDINYYLKEKPPVFGLALAIGSVIVLVLTAILLWLLSGWICALPLILFEDVAPSQVFRQSSRRAIGHRRIILLWILGWSLVTAAVAALATGAVTLIGSWLFPGPSVSLRMLAAFVGTFVVLGASVNFMISVVSSTTLAMVLDHLYRRLGGEGNRLILSPQRFGDRLGERGAFKITTPRLVAAALIGVLCAAIVGASAVASLRLDDRVQVMAHRGYSKAAPENTRAAIGRAIDAGADFVEIDVQETADGTVVILHDSDLMKIGGKNLKIWDARLDDLKDIDIGSWFGAEFKDERVPTFAEVLEQCRGKIRINIELKYYGHDQQLEQRVAELVESHGMQRDVIVMSLSLDGVRKMKLLRPDWKAGLLMSVATGDLRKLDVDFIAVNANFVNRAQIQQAHGSGKQIFAWTVNDPLLMSNLIGRGIDGLLTDDPQLARSVLRQRAQMTVLERLLLEIAARLEIRRGRHRSA